jgi:hypothetical protein
VCINKISYKIRTGKIGDEIVINLKKWILI